MTYDLDVAAAPVSLTMLSRAYPLRLKGLMSGPVPRAAMLSGYASTTPS